MAVAKPFPSLGLLSALPTSGWWEEEREAALKNIFFLKSILEIQAISFLLFSFLPFSKHSVGSEKYKPFCLELFHESSGLLF